MNKQPLITLLIFAIAVWTTSEARAEGRVNLTPASSESIEQFDAMIAHSRTGSARPALRGPQTSAPSAQASATIGAAVAQEVQKLQQASVTERKGTGRAISANVSQSQ